MPSKEELPATVMLAEEILGLIKDSKSFVVSQAPDVVQQVLRWKMYQNLFWILLGMIVTLPSIHGLLWAWVCSNRDDGAGVPVIVVGAIIFGFLGSMWIVDSTLEILQLKLAPKVYLLEYFSEFINHEE